MLQKYRSYLMPTAILLGILLYGFLYRFMGFISVLIFVILVLTYSKLDFSRIRFSKLNITLLLCHLLLTGLLYTVGLLFFSPIVTQSLLIGIIAPVAASSTTIAVILGGNREESVTFTILDNAMIVVAAPLFFVTAEHSGTSVTASILIMVAKIFPIVILPLITVFLLKKFLPKVNTFITHYEPYTILLWSFALMLTFSRTTYSIIHFGADFKGEIILMIVISMIMCMIQFFSGKAIGARLGDRVVGGQGLGQKNTGLAVWMAYTFFFSPLTIIYSAGYSLWQNVFNSLQLYLHDRKHKEL